MGESSNGSGSSVKYVDKRKPVKIKAETYEMLRHYSETCKTSITDSIDEAIRDWYETVGISRIEHRLGKSLKLC